MSIIDKIFKGSRNKDVSPLAKNVFESRGFFTGGKTWERRDFYYGITFSCIDAIATAVGSNKLELYKKGKNEETEVTNHPAMELLETPNQFQTGVDFKYQIASHIHTTGKAVIYPVKTTNGLPVELWLLDPTKLTTIKGTGFIDGYVYTNPMGNRIPFTPSELIVIYRPNPYNPYDGISTIEMARRAIEADLNAQDFNTTFFNNGANPSGILSTEGNLGEIEFERLKKMFAEKYEGKKNAYKTMVLEAGLKYQQVQLSQKDMDFVSQRNMSRDEIMSIFRVPKPILAITDDVNRANAETSNYVFSSRTVKPMLDLIVEKLNRFYLPLFKDDSLILYYENPVPEDKELLLRQNIASVNVWKTVNEVRDDEGLEPLEGGDELKPTSPTFNLSQKTKGLMTKSMKDKRYLFEKKKKRHSDLLKFKAVIKQHFGLLVKDISTKDLYHKRLKGVDDSLTTIIPDIEDWKSIMAKITIEHETNALKTSIALLNEYYNFPEVDLTYSGILGIIKDRANTVAYDASDTIVNNARTIIEQTLRDNQGATLKDLRNAVVDGLEDTAEYRAERIARTEMSYAYNEGALQDMKSTGVIEEVKRILGDDACELCAELEGVYKINEVPEIPTHPNCECDIVPYWS